MTDSKKMRPEMFLNFVHNGDDVIVSMANGEPVELLNTLEEHAARFTDVRVHQMHAQRKRAYIENKYPGSLRHVAYFLSGASREAFNDGRCDLVPNHFHDVPRIMWERTNHQLVLVTASPMDEDGYFTFGTNADYVSALIGKAPFFLEVNQQMPTTYGQNRIHVCDIEGYIEVDRPNHTIMPRAPSEKDEQMAAHIAELIPDGATLQVGIGGVPNAMIHFLKEKRDLGIHTEMLTDGIVDLAEAGAVSGGRKTNDPGKVVGTFALGTQRLYDFIHENETVKMMPVDYVNDPKVIGREQMMISINATTEVDFFGQCASETIKGRYYSSTGGQSDFAQGAAFSQFGRGFICLASTTRDEKISRIRPSLTPGSAVTTSKNDVHYIVTEYGAVNLKGKSISERAKLLIGIAHPKFREELTHEAKALSII
ncbi:acetyl-CoA hydrolase/transferase family protein [Salicibibacter cibarius]|uniref:Acetyl-CoA hydrolase/transferase family protein n=1 Tax=Salicibibacter cibarius TaxID=2743000 RepID=A0A7T6Z1L2_9BACI|nr:acetyl-CoA hydrolase/transferase family protein [Salicibibacter cibarius]QQK75315.1 acetyl-CoA hydrolase/transferase family protein [Salicibibacter cibarius]